MGAVDDDRQSKAIQYATAQLTALTGAAPRVIEEKGGVRIEVDVPEHLIRHWHQLVTVLELGTAYGLTNVDSRQIAWVRFDSERGTPE